MGLLNAAKTLTQLVPIFSINLIHYNHILPTMHDARQSAGTLPWVAENNDYPMALKQ